MIARLRLFKPSLISSIAVLNFCLFALAPRSAWADGIQQFVMPTSGDLTMQFIGGSAGGVTAFGLGTSPSNFIALFSGLPNNPSSLSPVNVGFFSAGTTINMGMFTTFAGDSGWAFSSGTDLASIVAFSDIDDSLGLGGSIIQQTGPDTWVLHLDDALSYKYDDDDNDVLMSLHITPISAAPEPASGLLLFSGGLFLLCWTALHHREHPSA